MIVVVVVLVGGGGETDLCNDATSPANAAPTVHQRAAVCEEAREHPP